MIKVRKKEESCDVIQAFKYNNDLFLILGPSVLEALIWSEALDEVFVQNYNSDPALSWQYFGSDTGIMRHYPGINFSLLKNETKE